MSNRFRNQIPSDWLHVATLGRTVGLKGDMKLNLFSDFPEQFRSGNTFFLENGTEITLESYNPDRELVRLRGIDTPESAKALTNARLFTTYAATRERCSLEEGEFFWFDMIGMDVRENDELLGKVKEIERIGSQDYLLVVTDQFFVSKGFPETFLIPYIDHYVLSTDGEGKIVSVQGGKDILEAS